MKKLVLMFSFCAFYFGSQAQIESLGKSLGETAFKNKPKESWSVNKKLDENGRVIHYDSTYSWSYSGQGKEFKWPEGKDPFSKFMDDDFFSVLGPTHFSRIWDDSLFSPVFPKGKFTNPRMNSPNHFQPIIKHFDSLHRQIFQHYFNDGKRKTSNVNYNEKRI